MKVLVISEHAAILPELVSGARQLGASEVTTACFENGDTAISDRSLIIEVPENAIIDDAFETLAPFAQESEVILAENTRRIKTIAGHLASKFQTAAALASVGLSQQGACGVYFGGVAERVQKPVGKAIYLVSSGVFNPEAIKGKGETETVDWVPPQNPVDLISVCPREKSAADPSKAEVVVAVGRGFTEEKQLDYARDLVDAVHGAIACSRPLTEGVNWLPSELYVGVSGITVSPKVYIAAGISGQMQHMVGCNKSGLVVAINNDKNAPIFKQCDFGIIGDVKEVLPALTAALQ